MNVYLNKIYDIEMTMYLKRLKKDQVKLNQKVCDDTIKSVINQTAIFLYNKSCPNCTVMLVDPVGIQIKPNLRHARHARCGNCGYSTLVDYKLT